jgi:hypothetical protein
MTAPTSNQGANAPIIAVLGVDRNIALTVTENAVARPWGGDTITALIYEKDGVTAAAVTTWTFTTGASGAATMSLTEAQLTTLGVGTYRYAVVNDTQDQPWFEGQLSVVGPTSSGTATTGITLALTTGGGITLTLSVVATTAAQVSVLDPNSYWLVDTAQGVADQVGADFARRAHNANGAAPTGAIGQSKVRNHTGSNTAALVSGRETLVLVWMNAGDIITSITVCSATTALVAGTNQWFSLRSSARVLLKTTADDTSTAWAANTAKTLTLSGGTYAVLTSGYYYIGIMVAAGTVPTLIGTNGVAGINNIALSVSGFDGTNTGLTTPATAPATSAVLTAHSPLPYVYYS